MTFLIVCNESRRHSDCEYRRDSVADYSYDPWGIVTVGGSSAVKDQPIRYASYAQDAETNLYYLQARYYDPDNARFVSRDPHGGTLTNPLSQNAYAYGNGDPVNNVDPDGRLAGALAIGKRTSWSLWNRSVIVLESGWLGDIRWSCRGYGLCGI
ncbi:MAG: RHS repeat-associated core domain-containing protein [Desulfitobacterium hafniense]